MSGRLSPSVARRSTPALYRSIYAIVRRIPRGKVATYGQVAKILGKPRAARAVGAALRALPDALVDRVPWQRVINAAGRCSKRGGFWAERQRERLEAEGVRVDGRGRVDLKRTAWAGPSTAEIRKLRRAAASSAQSQRGIAPTRSRWVSRPA